jgi:hypothetical protein
MTPTTPTPAAGKAATMTEIKPGDRITITAVVESAGHDDQHVIVRIGGIPVQVPVSSLLAAEKADPDDDEPVPDWRFEWELVGRTRGENAGDYVLHHKSDGRYRIIHEEDW